jgi:hypothetical protein
MAELSSNRTSDATKIGQTDNWDIELEQDIADLIGVALDHVISSPIFASGSFDDGAVDANGGAQVNTDGSINGVLRFLTTAATAKAASGVEFETTDGSRFKLCAMASSLDLYEYVDDAWVFLASLNEGIGTFLGLSDVSTDDPDPNTFVGHGGEFVVVNDDEDALTFSAIAPTASVAQLSDIGDVPEYPVTPHVGKFLKLWDDETLEWVGSDPGSGAQSIAELDDVIDTFVPSETTQMGVAEIANTSLPATPNWQVVHRPGSWAYGVSIGLHESPNETYISPTDPERWKLYPDTYKYVYFTPSLGSLSPGDLSALVFFEALGDDFCDINSPNNYPGLWKWEMEMGIVPNGDFNDFLISDVEVSEDQGGEFLAVHTVGYHHGIYYYNTSTGQNRFYNFYNSYMVSKCHWYTKLNKETPSAGKFRIKIKAARMTEPVTIMDGHKINLIGTRIR